MKKLKNLLKNNKGLFSLEAVIAMAAVLMVTALGISYFTYLTPRQVLTQEVHNLAQTAKIQGGLTNEISEPGNSDIKRFEKRMEEKGIDSSKIVVTAEATSKGSDEKRNVLGVEPLSEGTKENARYSPRNSKEIITVQVTIPAKTNFINVMSRYWTGKDSTLSDYKFTETIMSERW